MEVTYTVVASFSDPMVANEFVTWLEAGHLAQVLRGGARAAEVIRLTPQEGELVQIEVRYRFDSRSAFERYEAVSAPALRADGAKRFGPQRGVQMRRTVGEVVTAVSAPG
jgi:hypothetical protein